MFVVVCRYVLLVVVRRCSWLFVVCRCVDVRRCGSLFAVVCRCALWFVVVVRSLLFVVV